MTPAPRAPHSPRSSAPDSPRDSPAGGHCEDDWTTERTLGHSDDLDALGTTGVVEIILDADAAVAAAVRAVADDVAAAADLVIEAPRRTITIRAAEINFERE